MYPKVAKFIVNMLHQSFLQISLKLILHSEYQIFFLGNFLEIWKFSRVCYVWPISMYGASFPLNFSHWNWFCTQNIKFPHFSAIFPLSLGHRTWFWTQNLKFPVFLDLFFWKYSGNLKNHSKMNSAMKMEWDWCPVCWDSGKQQI